MKKLLYGFGLITSLLGIFLLLGGADLFTPTLFPQIQQIPQEVKISPAEQTSLLIEPEAGISPIIDAINQTVSSIDLTIYTISDSRIINALISAQKKGVNVRTLYNDHFFSGSGKATNQKTMDILTKAGIKTKKSSSDFTLTHQKSFVLDNSKAIIMTFNLEPSYFSTSRDFAIITTDASVVAEIKAVFEADWQGNKINPNNPSLIWSPDNSKLKLKKIIDNAQNTLDIYTMELQDDDIMNTLIQAKERGVAIRIISAELSNIGGEDANMNWRQALTEAGIANKIDKTLFTHAKVILADYGTNKQIAYVGSINFSENSIDKNRELGILSSDSVALDRLQKIFNDDWKLAN
jgi:cardiolipin synthase A/B